MFKMFKQMFTALTILFMAAEKGAKAVDHLATWAEGAAGAFADEAQIERAKKMAALQASLANQQAAIDNNATSQVAP